MTVNPFKATARNESDAMTAQRLRRVVVTGLGAITPLGMGARATWERVVAGECGIVSTSHLEPRHRWRGLKSTVAGLIPSHVGDGTTGAPKGAWQPLDWHSPADLRRMPKYTQLAIAATEMALQDSEWRPSTDHDLAMTGVCLGSGLSTLDDLYTTTLEFERDERERRKISPLFIPRILPNLAAGHVSMRYGFRGPNHAVSMACTTGANSIGDAGQFIALGKADVMVAGGAESCIHPLTFAGFGSSRSLATAYNDDAASACRPFDRGRDGFVVAEGAAVVILEELEHAKARGARILAELRGYGLSADAHHVTAPRADGSGAIQAMRMALREARLQPRQVDYINAHATGTRAGDTAEAAGIGTLMLGDDGVEKPGHVAVSSTKGATGHLLGAAGAIEAVFSILAITENVLPPTLNLHSPDVGAAFNFVPLQAQEKQVKVAMSNSFGFGGTNASLVFSRLE